MREIKFRAWDTRDKEMVYRAEHSYDCGAYYSVDLCVSCFGELLDDDRYNIEQYTGLKDKNGKEIYEGDIVANGSLTGVVEYKVEDFCAWTVGATTNGYVLLNSSWSVIGNIHENAELLGGEE